MPKSKQILNSVSAIIVLVAFFISTTGFAFYNHVCNHHGSEVTLIVSNCCDEEQEVTNVSSHSCCEPETAQSVCQDEQSTTSCCDFNIKYFHLSEQFVDPQSYSKDLDLSVAELVCFDRDSDLLVDCVDSNTNQVLTNVKPKEPIYRLYQQVKIDPPLI